MPQSNPFPLERKVNAIEANHSYLRHLILMRKHMICCNVRGTTVYVLGVDALRPSQSPIRLNMFGVSTLSFVAALMSDHRRAWLDRAGLGLSALCAAHCLTTAIALTALASFGGILLSPLIHEIGLMLAIIVGALALALGVLRHGYLAPFATGSFGLGIMAGALSLPHGDGEMLATLIGVAILALGHDLNYRATN